MAGLGEHAEQPDVLSRRAAEHDRGDVDLPADEVGDHQRFAAERNVRDRVPATWRNSSIAASTWLAQGMTTAFNLSAAFETLSFHDPATEAAIRPYLPPTTEESTAQ